MADKPKSEEKKTTSAVKKPTTGKTATAKPASKPGTGSHGC